MNGNCVYKSQEEGYIQTEIPQWNVLAGTAHLHGSHAPAPGAVFASSTWSSQVVFHPSTIQAQCCSMLLNFLRSIVLNGVMPRRQHGEFPSLIYSCKLHHQWIKTSAKKGIFSPPTCGKGRSCNYRMNTSTRLSYLNNGWTLLRPWWSGLKRNLFLQLECQTKNTFFVRNCLEFRRLNASQLGGE